MYEFAPNVNVVKGPHAPDSPIFIQANNVALCDFIPKQFMNSRIEDCVNYVKICPLRYDFCDFSDPFYHKQVFKFYYSLYVDSDAQTIIGTIRDG